LEVNNKESTACFVHHIFTSQTLSYGMATLYFIYLRCRARRLDILFVGIMLKQMF